MAPIGVVVPVDIPWIRRVVSHVALHLAVGGVATGAARLECSVGEPKVQAALVVCVCEARQPRGRREREYARQLHVRPPSHTTA